MFLQNITCFCLLKCLFHFEVSSDAINTLPGLSVPAAPGTLTSLAVTSAVSGQMTIPGVTDVPGNSVLLVSNLNPEVSLIGGTDASINLYQLPECFLQIYISWRNKRGNLHADNIKNRTALFLFEIVCSIDEV